jgi:hypothetical protein
MQQGEFLTKFGKPLATEREKLELFSGFHVPHTRREFADGARYLAIEDLLLICVVSSKDHCDRPWSASF